jgi:MFS family permease
VVWSVPAGLLAKRFGEKVVLAAGLGTVAVGLGTLGIAPSFVTAFGARAVWLSVYSSGHINAEDLKQFDTNFAPMLKDPRTNELFRVPFTWRRAKQTLH